MTTTLVKDDIQDASANSSSLTVSVDERVNALKTNIEVVQRVMKDVMRDGEHYGVIPGTNKPTLYKSGAEKLSLVMRLATEYSIKQTDLPNGHREYEVICKLYSIETGKFLGSGVGICSTMEKKYRYRNEYKATNEPVPKAYWDNGQNKKYLPKGMSVTKTESGWRLARIEQIENPDIADCYNTVLKIGKKRSQVDATLTVTAASDIFSQDIEDFVEADSVSEQEGARPEKEISSAPKADSKPDTETKSDKNLSTTPAEKEVSRERFASDSATSKKSNTTKPAEVSLETPIGKPASKEHKEAFFKTNGKAAFISNFGVEILKIDGMYLYVPVGSYKKQQAGQPIDLIPPASQTKANSEKPVNGRSTQEPVRIEVVSPNRISRLIGNCLEDTISDLDDRGLWNDNEEDFPY